MSDLFTLEAVDDLDSIVVPKRVPRIERVPIVKEVEGIVCCEKLFKLPTHYHNGFTRLCAGKANCTIHKTAGFRLYFLCAVWTTHDREMVWYQLPPAAAKALLFGVKTLGRPLFGTAVKLTRKWKEKNAPVLLSVNPYTSPQQGMPRPLTPEESVKRCFFSDVEKTRTKPKKAV